MVFDTTSAVLAVVFAALDDHGPSLEADGRTFLSAEVTPGRAMTTLGPVAFLRLRCRPSRTGAFLIQAEAVLSPSASEKEDAWRQLFGQGPSTASPVRLSGENGELLWRSVPERFWKISWHGTRCPQRPCRSLSLSTAS